MPLKDFSYWVDANLPPKKIGRLRYHFDVTAKQVYEMIGLLASDEAFYLAAKEEGSVTILTKDIDFVKLQQRFGAPPKIIWITAGNSIQCRAAPAPKGLLSTCCATINRQ